MPFKSDEQRRFMYSQHPEIAKRWSAEAKGGVKKPRKRRRSRAVARMIKKGRD